MKTVKDKRDRPAPMTKVVCAVTIASVQAIQPTWSDKRVMEFLGCNWGRIEQAMSAAAIDAVKECM